MATGRLPDPNTAPVTAKGDLYTYSTVPAKLAVGNNGETLVADSSTATGLRYQGSQVAAKNAIINGGMDIWQRGTSFAADRYTADRWYQSGGNGTSAQETTTVPDGFRYAMKFTASGTTQPNFLSALETNDSLRFAGQTVCFSAYFASSTTRAVELRVQYSTTIDNAMLAAWTTITATSGGTGTATSTYSRVSGVWAIPSSAKCIRVIMTTGASMATSEILYATGAQLELGSVPTAFLRTGGTLAGELAACQRYYYRTSAQTYGRLGFGSASSSTNAQIIVNLPATMRTAPASVDYSTLLVYDTVSLYAVTNVTLTATGQSSNTASIDCTVASGLTQYRPYSLANNNSASAYVGFSAEL